MKNTQRLIFQHFETPKGNEEGVRRENLAGTDAKNVVSQAGAKLERFFGGTTVSQLYKQIEKTTNSNAAFTLREKLIQLTPRNEDEKKIVLEQIVILQEIYYISQFGSSYQQKHPDGAKKMAVLDKRRKEVESLKF